MQNYLPPIQEVIDKHIATHIDQFGRMTYIHQYSLDQFVEELVLAAIRFGFEQGELYATKGKQNE